MKVLFLLFFISICACSPYKNTSYRVLNRNGKVVYFEDKKTPIYNNQMRASDMKDVVDVSKKAKETSKQGKYNNMSNISNEMMLDSSAYTLNSVVDNVVRDDDIRQVAKTINKNKNSKTIEDFNDIPDHYFSGDSNLIVNKPSNIVNNNDVLRDNSKQGFFSRIFNRKNKKIENIETTDTLVGVTSGISPSVDNSKVSDGTAKNYELSNPRTVKDSDLNIKDSPAKTPVVNSTKVTNNTKSNSNNKVGKAIFVRNNNRPVVSESLVRDKYYIQLGSFQKESSAKDLINKFSDIGNSRTTVKLDINGKTFYRSIVGTFNTKVEAEKEMEKVLNKGHFDCYVFKN